MSNGSGALINNLRIAVPHSRRKGLTGHRGRQGFEVLTTKRINEHTSQRLPLGASKRGINIHPAILVLIVAAAR